MFRGGVQNEEKKRNKLEIWAGKIEKSAGKVGKKVKVLGGREAGGIRKWEQERVE